MSNKISKVGRKLGGSNKTTPAKKKLVLKSLEENNGIISLSLDKVAIARGTFEKWTRIDPKFKEEVDQIIQTNKKIMYEKRVQMFHVAEKQLYQKVEDGFWPSIKYVCETIGKDFGYTTKTETEHTVLNKEIKFIFGNEEKSNED